MPNIYMNMRCAGKYAAQQRHIDTVEPCIWTTYTPHMDTRIPIIYRFYRRIVAEFQFWANANAGEQTKLSVTDTKKKMHSHRKW